MTAWTDEHVSQLKQMWTEGLSASTIAARIGCFTRNAILGKVDRLGLETHKVVRQGRAKVKMPRALRIRINSRNHAIAPVQDIPAAVPTIDDMAIPAEQRRTFHTLRRGECRYPVGDVGQPEFFFCGAAQAEESSYCAAHRARCTQGFPPRAQTKRFALPQWKTGIGR